MPQSAKAIRPKSRLPAWFGVISRPAALEVAVGVAVDVSVVFICLVVVVAVDIDIVVVCIVVVEAVVMVVVDSGAPISLVWWL